jgi:ferrous iron transport protein A
MANMVMTAVRTVRSVRPGAGEYVVRELSVPDRARRRLAELGVRIGEIVRVVQHTAGGGVVLAVGTSRIALDRRTASDVLVEPLP